MKWLLIWLRSQSTTPWLYSQARLKWREQSGEYLVAKHLVLTQFQCVQLVAHNTSGSSLNCSFSCGIRKKSHIWFDLRYQFDGKLFSLWRLQAKTKMQSDIIHKFLFVDDCTHNVGIQSKIVGKLGFILCNLWKLWPCNKHKEYWGHIPTHSCYTLHSPPSQLVVKSLLWVISSHTLA